MCFLLKRIIPFGIQIIRTVIAKPSIFSNVTIIKTSYVLGIQIGKVAVEVFVFNRKAIGWKVSNMMASSISGYLW